MPTIITRQRKKKRSRPKPRPPKPGLTAASLAALAGVTHRSLRFYLERDLLPPVKFAGKGTRYERRHLVWLVAIQKLRAAERLSLDEISKRLRAMSDAELDALVSKDLAPGKLAEALGVALAPPPMEPRVVAPPSDAKRWLHVELALGLELHFREDAGADVKQLAADVWRFCRSRGSAPAEVFTPSGGETQLRGAAREALSGGPE